MRVGHPRAASLVIVAALGTVLAVGPSGGPDPQPLAAPETAPSAPRIDVTAPAATPIADEPSSALQALEAGVGAVPVARGVCLSDPDYCSPPPTEPIPTPYGTLCAQWWDLAETIGWPRSQLSLMGAVMSRESHCRPGAYNPTSCGGGNHAQGLMQLCGWRCDPSCFDPAGNLTAALHLWERSGWCPWVYNDHLTRHACG